MRGGERVRGRILRFRDLLIERLRDDSLARNEGESGRRGERERGWGENSVTP